MSPVPREEFVSPAQRADARIDRPLPIGHGQTISQPSLVEYMTDALELEKGDRVLEIGTGSGYQAAVLAERVAEVYTVEIIESLAEEAKARLKRLGYDNVWVKRADGYEGWSEKAPFDAIVVTAAAADVPEPLIAQLKDGGKMIVPVGRPDDVQSLVLVEKQGAQIDRRELMAVRFVPFTRDAESGNVG